jgi:hypothetical protein
MDSLVAITSVNPSREIGRTCEFGVYPSLGLVVGALYVALLDAIIAGPIIRQAAGRTAWVELCDFAVEVFVAFASHEVIQVRRAAVDEEPGGCVEVAIIAIVGNLVEALEGGWKRVLHLFEDVLWTADGRDLIRVVEQIVQVLPGLVANGIDAIVILGIIIVG